MKRWIAIAVCLLALAGAVGPVSGQASLDSDGSGWQVLALEGGGVLLRWTIDGELPTRGARPEFHSGDEVLGSPVQRGEVLELVVADGSEARLGPLSVWLGSTRLDGPTPAGEPTGGDDGRALLDRARPPVIGTDPGEPGRFATETLSYDLDPLPFGRYGAPIEVVGEVIAPVGAGGARPLVLFLHGRHATCYQGGPDGLESSDWPCPGGWSPIPSHLGYRYVAQLLASQGYVTVSIAANAINAFDGFDLDGGARARSVLIRHHLALWADWAAQGSDPWGGRFEGRVDVGQTVLVGHSRGGEGVERAAADSRRRDPWRIRGLVPIAPTSFGRQQTAGIPTAVILPYCDGDVSDLQGQPYVDNSRDLVGSDASLRSSVLVMGANHNYFNTEWTPGQAVAPAIDDWLFAGPPEDPTCGDASPLRLSPTEQQAVGATYVAALVAVAVRRDTRVAPLLDGSDVRAASAGPAIVFTHALGARREPLLVPSAALGLRAEGLSARVCRGFLPGDLGVVSECAPAIDVVRMPHFLPMGGGDGMESPEALEVAWSQPGGTARVDLGVRDLSGRGDLELRVAVDPSVGQARFGIRLVDASGGVTRLPGRVVLEPLPGIGRPLGRVWATTVRRPLGRPAGVDLSRIVAIELVAISDAGRIWVLDAHQRRPGLVPTRARFLPQFSVGRISIPEGDEPGTARVPLRRRGPVRERAILSAQYVTPLGVGGVIDVVVRPGQRRVFLRLPVPGDDQYTQNLGRFDIVLAARRAATTGRYIGALRIVEDDPAPQLSAEVSPSPLTEGGELVLTVTLSEPIVGTFFAFVRLDPPSGALAGLDTDDVPADWLTTVTGMPPPIPAVPLGQVINGLIEIPSGSTSGTYVVPIAADGLAEGDEGIAFVVDLLGDPISPQPIVREAVIQNGS